MAKQRMTTTSVSALHSLLSTIDTVAKVELAGNPEALAEVTKMTAGVKDSNITTAMELQDDSIEAMHNAEDAEEAAEAAAAEEPEEEILTLEEFDEQQENETTEPIVGEPPIE